MEPAVITSPMALGPSIHAWNELRLTEVSRLGRPICPLAEPDTRGSDTDKVGSTISLSSHFDLYNCWFLKLIVNGLVD